MEPGRSRPLRKDCRRNRVNGLRESRTAAREPLARWTRSVTVPVTAPQPGVVLILTLNALAVVLLCPLPGMPRALRDSEYRCDTRAVPQIAPALRDAPRRRNAGRAWNAGPLPGATSAAPVRSAMATR